MRILLTGAEGFTGQHFARIAEAAGHACVPLRSDLTQRAALFDEVATAQVDSVVHLAAIAFVAHHDERALYDVNLFGTLNLLDALAATGRAYAKVLLASSANVYGNCEASPIGEAQAPAPVNHYAMSKLAMELMARARAPSFPLVIARPFNYTGPGQARQFLIPKLVHHFRQRAERIALGNLHVEREYNDVRMVCEAYLRLLTGEALGTFNVCTGEAWPLTSVIAQLEEITGHRVQVDVDPEFVRPNELHRLCGDPAQLRRACPGLPRFALGDTLRWMLGTAD